MGGACGKLVTLRNILGTASLFVFFYFDDGLLIRRLIDPYVDLLGHVLL